MHLLAFSVQGEVEKYGAYVGIAAFLGLAVLTLLYFSQAREVKRLREWAGRAPERAAEIEAQAVANAEAAKREREAAAAGAAAPAASAVNGAPARQLRPEEIAAAAFARAAGVPVLAGAATGEAPAATPPADAEGPQQEDTGAVAARVVAAEEAAGGDRAGAEATAGGGPAGPEAIAGGEPAGAEATAQHAPVEAAPAADEEPQAADAPPAPNGHRDDVPTIPPAATPAARRGAPPVPAPSPRRAAPAVPAASRRPAAAPAQGGRSPSVPTIAALVCVGIVVLAAAVFAATQLLGGNGKSQPPAPTQAATASPTSTAATTPRASALTPAATRVAVLNSTPIPGLAASTRDQLAADGYGKSNLSTGNFSGPQRQQSVVLYRRGARRAATAVGRILDIATVQPVDSAAQAQAQGKGPAPDVIVVVGGDKSR